VDVFFDFTLEALTHVNSVVVKLDEKTKDDRQCHKRVLPPTNKTEIGPLVHLVGNILSMSTVILSPSLASCLSSANCQSVCLPVNEYIYFPSLSLINACFDALILSVIMGYNRRDIAWQSQTIAKDIKNMK
jgi:hypothetical protein